MQKKRFLTVIINIVIIFSLITVHTLTKYTDKGQKNTGKISLDYQDTSAETIKFHFLDVGQGDATLIQCGKINILIDAGTQESGSDVYRYLKELKINYLDYFIGTHPHEDHLGGASAVLSSIDTGTVFINKDTSSSYFYERFIDTLIQKNITPVFPDMDCIYKIGPLRIKFLSPKQDFSDANNNSIVTLIEFDEIKALFMGDCERPVEAELLKSNTSLAANILKVGHHGSRYASSAEFLNIVYPEVSIIQCAKNNTYNHPHKETLDRLSSINSTILRTDESGTIVLISDGKTIRNKSGEEFKRNYKNKINLVYFGNTKSKVFHTESCPNLPGDKNKIELPSREDALDQGYKICGNCTP